MRWSSPLPGIWSPNNVSMLRGKLSHRCYDPSNLLPRRCSIQHHDASTILQQHGISFHLWSRIYSHESTCNRNVNVLLVWGVLKFNELLWRGCGDHLWEIPTSIQSHLQHSVNTCCRAPNWASKPGLVEYLFWPAERGHALFFQDELQHTKSAISFPP